MLGSAAAAGTQAAELGTSQELWEAGTFWRHVEMEDAEMGVKYRGEEVGVSLALAVLLVTATTFSPPSKAAKARPGVQIPALALTLSQPKPHTWNSTAQGHSHGSGSVTSLDAVFLLCWLFLFPHPRATGFHGPSCVWGAAAPRTKEE